METFDYTKFVKRIPVRCGIPQIYDGWATQDGLEKWFLRLAEFTKPDQSVRDRYQQVQAKDTYRWLWHGWCDTVTETGTVYEANGKDFLRFSFGEAGMVSVQIKMEEGETIVELVQDQIPVDERSKMNYFNGCQTGWTFYLANLKSVLEGGLDLRNKNEKLLNVVNS